MRAPCVLALSALAVLGCDAAGTSRAAPSAVASTAAPVVRAAEWPAGFLKGQLHAHTGNSADSETDPAEAAAWYAARGYDFVVFTDHNVVTEIAAPAGMLLMRGVELTQNLRTCEPAPEPGEACLLHVSALFVRPERGPIRFSPDAPSRRQDLYGRAVDRAIELGGVAQLDHPNFHHGADLDLVVAMARRGVSLLEVMNEAVDSNNEGDARCPSTEALWDAALARGARVFATATDDAHHYGDAERVRARGGIAYTGDRGFVMVRAENNEAAIRAAIVAGDFYGTTGVILERLSMSRAGIEIDAREGGGPVTFEVIGDGRVVETARGLALRHAPAASGAAVVRVRVTDARGRRALTQPIFTR